MDLGTRAALTTLVGTWFVCLASCVIFRLLPEVIWPQGVAASLEVAAIFAMTTIGLLSGRILDTPDVMKVMPPDRTKRIRRFLVLGIAIAPLVQLAYVHRRSDPGFNLRELRSGDFMARNAAFKFLNKHLPPEGRERAARMAVEVIRAHPEESLARDSWDLYEVLESLTLGRALDAEATRMLSTRLQQSSHAKDRERIAHLLGRRAALGEEVISTLTGLLDGDRVPQRRALEALLTLVEQHAERNVPGLQRPEPMMSEPVPERDRRLQIQASLGPAAAGLVRELVSRVTSVKVEEAGDLLELLSRIVHGSPEVQRAMRPFLTAGNDEQRLRAAWYLGCAGVLDPEVTEILWKKRDEFPQNSFGWSWLDQILRGLPPPAPPGS